jgi:hypothetical protein
MGCQYTHAMCVHEAHAMLHDARDISNRIDYDQPEPQHTIMSRHYRQQTPDTVRKNQTPKRIITKSPPPAGQTRPNAHVHAAAQYSLICMRLPAHNHAHT